MLQIHLETFFVQNVVKTLGLSHVSLMVLPGHPDRVQFNWSPTFFPRTIPDVMVQHLSTARMTSPESQPPALLNVIFITVFLTDGPGVRTCVNDRQEAWFQ